VIAYDDANGSLAARRVVALELARTQSGAVLDGGFKAWVRAGGAVEVGEPPHSPGGAKSPFTVRLRPEDRAGRRRRAAGARRFAAAVGGCTGAERFAGTVEPLDLVAGHVPGAVNHPFTANLTPDGRFLPLGELRRRWLTRLAARRRQTRS